MMANKTCCAGNKNFHQVFSRSILNRGLLLDVRA
jgi:hypothetical protein